MCRCQGPGAVAIVGARRQACALWHATDGNRQRFTAVGNGGVDIKCNAIAFLTTCVTDLKPRCIGNTGNIHRNCFTDTCRVVPIGRRHGHIQIKRTGIVISRRDRQTVKVVRAKCPCTIAIVRPGRQGRTIRHTPNRDRQNFGTVRQASINIQTDRRIFISGCIRHVKPRCIGNTGNIHRNGFTDTCGVVTIGRRHGHIQIKRTGIVIGWRDRQAVKILRAKCPRTIAVIRPGRQGRSIRNTPNRDRQNFGTVRQASINIQTDRRIFISGCIRHVKARRIGNTFHIHRDGFADTCCVIPIGRRHGHIQVKRTGIVIGRRDRQAVKVVRAKCPRTIAIIRPGRQGRTIRHATNRDRQYLGRITQSGINTQLNGTFFTPGCICHIQCRYISISDDIDHYGVGHTGNINPILGTCRDLQIKTTAIVIRRRDAQAVKLVRI